MIKNTAIVFILFLCATGLFFTTCTYRKGVEPAPVNSKVSYALQVKPILVANCYMCHTDTSTNPDRPGYAFFNHFDQLQAVALRHSTVNPNYTVLIARLKHIESPGMPFQRNPLSDSLIQIIQDWVLIGAPEN